MKPVRTVATIATAFRGVTSASAAAATSHPMNADPRRLGCAKDLEQFL